MPSSLQSGWGLYKQQVWLGLMLPLSAPLCQHLLALICMGIMPPLQVLPEYIVTSKSSSSSPHTVAFCYLVKWYRAIYVFQFYILINHVDGIILPYAGAFQVVQVDDWSLKLSC